MIRIVRFSPLRAAVLALVVTAGAQVGGPVAAQGAGGLFAPVLTVNGMGVSRYELEQRMRFMQLLRQSGDLRKAAEDGLIEDRLRVWKAKQDGIAVTPDQVKEGMTEFAGRANLTLEQFVAELAGAGISEETFRDFVTAGMLWREEVRSRYAGRIQISESDIDRAMLVESERGRGTRVLISEIIIPAPPEHAAEARQLAQEISQIRGEGEFGNAARQVSAAQTRDQGGRLDWMPLQNLPPALRPTVLALKPGEASAPIDLNGAIAVFMLRAMDEGGSVGGAAQKLGYATLALGAPGSEAAAALTARVAADAKRCDDLYTIAKDQPAAVTRVAPQPQGAIAQDIGVALAGLDIGETTVLRQGAGQVLVMLCSRERVVDTEKGETAPDRAAIRNRLMNERISGYADRDIAALKANAVIVRP